MRLLTYFLSLICLVTFSCTPNNTTTKNSNKPAAKATTTTKTAKPKTAKAAEGKWTNLKGDNALDIQTVGNSLWALRQMEKGKVLSNWDGKEWKNENANDISQIDRSQCYSVMGFKKD